MSHFVGKHPQDAQGTRLLERVCPPVEKIVLLPIDAVREHIVATIRENQVTIVVGATGSGKTTRLPVFLYEACFSTKGTIGITEPRRIAASSVAKYVAEQLNTKLGEKVGYQVRFDDETSAGTKIKFMTDGILLREIQLDPTLSKYSVIMVDEAHERSVNIDFTLGLLKDLLTRRSDLKVVVSSATIDVDKFSNYFDDAIVVEVPGRTFDVETIWSTEDYSEREMVDAVVEKISTIHLKQPKGDVLVFMTGADDINRVVEKLERFGYSDMIVLPAHGGLAPDDQKKIFENFGGKRKVIVATNIAETSITVDGVVYVVDSGLVKQTSFNAQTGIQSLDVVEHSQAGCAQRAGRAGRTRPGVCYRMYMKEGFNSRPAYTEPEIRRMSLASVVLTMESIGIKDVEGFEFVDQPDRKAFHEAYETLIALGAISADRSELTDIGVAMANLPLEPRIARMVLEADKHGCVKEIATIAAFLSQRNIFVRPKGKEWEVDAKHALFKVHTSDALTFLKVWRAYEAAKFERQWCFDHFLHLQSLGEVRNIRSQLLTILDRGGMTLSSAKDDESVVRSVAAGLVQNLLQAGGRHMYEGLLRANLYSVFIHPGSAVFGWSDPRWVVCTEIVNTTRTFARGVSEVKPQWLPELAPSQFSYGRTTLVRLSEDGTGVVAYRPIMQRSRFDNLLHEVGTRQEVIISFEEARKVQDENIREAEQKGMIPLSFTEELSEYGRFLNKMVCELRGIKYEASLFSKVQPRIGATYFCLVRPNLYRTFFEHSLEADPQFEILSIPTSSTEGEEVSTEDKLVELKKAWGAR